MHPPVRALRLRFPLALISLTLIIALTGIVNLCSAASAVRPNLYMVQFGWLIIGFTMCVIISFFHTKIIYNTAYFVLGGVLLLLVAVLVIGISAKGGQRWINLGLFRVQPSELAKIGVVVACARYFSDNPVKNGFTLRTLLRPLNISRPIVCLLGVIGFLVLKNGLALPWANVLVIPIFFVILFWFILALNDFRRGEFALDKLVAPIDIAFLPFFLILVQPDLGTGLVILAISGSMILFCRVRIVSLLIIAVGCAALSVVLWKTVLWDYQKQRIETFLNPESDLLGNGYHAAQSLIAIGSGKFFGKGFGEGTQTQLSFLPENHTDFVFAVLGEEWGFLGTIFLMAMFFALIVVMLNIGTKAEDRFSGLLVVGCAAMIFWQVVINVGMVTGVLPVVGITLPLVSYGGASMLIQWMAVAMCANVAIWRKAK